MKKIIYSAFFLSFILILFSSCKKNTPAQATTPQSNSGTSMSGFTVLSNGYPNGSYNSVFQIGTNDFYGTTMIYGYADFYKSAINLANFHYSDTTVTYVSLNGNKMKHNYYGEYQDTANPFSAPPATWVVSGNTVIPSFTFTASDQSPVIGNITYTTTISKLTDLTITFSNCNYYNGVMVSLSDGYGHSTLSGTNTGNAVTIKSDSLTKLTVGTNGILTFGLVKYNAQTLSGKNALFCNSTAKSYTVSIQ